MAEQLLTGYDKFKAAGLAIKAKNGVVRQAPSTPVKSNIVSIEEKVIEKKVERFNNFELLKPAVQSQQKPFNVNQLRVVNNTQYFSKGELVLPEQILNLVDNKAYLPRHRKLARDYGVKYLLKVAELAQTKGKPSHWYAKATSKANWQQTVEMLIKLFKKIDQMKEKLQGINVTDKWINYFVGAADKLPEFRFNNCVELAKARGSKKPPNLLAKAIKINLEQHLQLQSTKLTT